MPQEAAFYAHWGGKGFALGSRALVGVEQGVGHGGAFIRELVQGHGQAERSCREVGAGVVCDQGRDTKRPSVPQCEACAVKRVESGVQSDLCVADVVEVGRSDEDRPVGRVGRRADGPGPGCDRLRMPKTVGKVRQRLPSECVG